MFPDDYFWNPSFIKTLRFYTSDGALMTSWMFGTFVEDPQTDTLAFQRGTHYRKGGAIQVTSTNGFELLRYSSYLFLDEAAIPTLPVNTATNGTIPFAGGTQWYWFTGETGITYKVRLAASGQNYYANITDREGITLGRATNGPLTWACSSNGTYAIAVSATNVFDYTLSLVVHGLCQPQGDYDDDGKTDLAVFEHRRATGISCIPARIH